MRIYTEASAKHDREAALSFRALTPDVSVQPPPGHETSLAHFCAFADFYTRQATDPMSTSLACEKQAEVVEITAEDATPENLRLLLDTMLEVIDHLEKKWLDEQITHEDRQRKHREDVAHLSQQLWELQPEPQQQSFYEKGIQWIVNSFSWKKETRMTTHQPTTSSKKPHKRFVRPHKSKALHAPANA